MAAPYLARDDAGNIWSVDENGNKTFVSRGATSMTVKPAPPAYQYEGPQAAATLQRTQQEVQQTAATMQANEDKAKADAKSAELAAATAQEQYDINHPKANGTEGLSGPAYMQFLQKSDPGRAAYIQGLAEGRVPFPSATMMRSPAGQALLTQVMRADPTIDATNYSTRAAARKNAATGNLSKSDNALITAIGHAARLNSLVPEVFGTPLNPINGIANYVDSKWFNGEQPAYNQNASLLGNELAAAYGANTEGKQNEAASQFDPSLSTKQKEDNIRGAIDLMASKLAANRAQFAYGNGQLGKPDFMLLPEQTRNELLSIPGGKDIANKYFTGIPSMGGGGNNGGDNPPMLGGGGSGGPKGPPDYSTMTGGPQARVATGPYRNVYDPVVAGGLNALIHRGASVDEANAYLSSHGYNPLSGQEADTYGQAVTYAKQPGHSGVNLVSANKTVPTSVGEQLAASPAASFLAGGASGATAGLSDVAGRAALGPMWDANMAALAATNPKADLAGNVVGTIGGALGAGKAVNAGVDALKANPFLARYFTGVGLLPKAGLVGTDAAAADASAAARRALTGDMLYSGTSGAAQNPDNPALGAAEGMAAMGAGNVAGRYVVGPAIRGGAKVFNKAANLVGAAPLDIPAALSPGQNMIFNRSGGDALSGIQNNLQDASNLNLPYSLADSDPRLRLLAGSASRKSPDVRALAENVLGPRQQGQGERAIAQINSNLAPVGDVPSIVADATQRAQQAASPLYDQAYSTPGRTSDTLNSLLSTPAGKQALIRARTIAANEQRDPNALGFDLNDQGEVSLTKVPSLQTLDYVKRGLDDILEPYRNQFTGKLQLDEAGRAINGVRAKFLNEADRLFPDYANARSAYGDIASQGTAAQNGAAANSIRVTPEQTQSMMTNAGNNLPFFQRGYASDMADQVERGRLSGNPYNLIYGSMGQRAKVGSVFPQGAAAFGRANDLEGDMAKTATELTGGSQTQPRAEADAMFSNPVANAAGDIAFSAATGVPTPNLIRKGVQAFLDAKQLGVLGAKSKADQIGPILLNTDPKAALSAIQALRQQALMRQIYVNQTGTLGGSLAAPILFGATQGQ